MLETVCGDCQSCPTRRKKVPYSGPDAPPTELTRAMPTWFRYWRVVVPGAGAIVAAVARPRAMFVP